MQCCCFKNNVICQDKRLPFKKQSNMTDIIIKMNKFVTKENDTGPIVDISSYEYLFRGNEYANSLIIDISIEEATLKITEDDLLCNDKFKIIIIFGEDPPTRGEEIIENTLFELRVVSIIKRKSLRNSIKYNAIRYMRHGIGFKSWWKQERNEHSPSQCINGENIYEEMINNDDEELSKQYISIYVRNQENSSDK